MTAILGIRTNGVTYIASDSRCSMDGAGAWFDRQPKLFNIGAGVLGLSNWMRMAYLISRNAEIFDGARTPDTLAVALRKTIEEDGWVAANDPEDQSHRPILYQTQFLLASPEGLYHYDGTLTPSRIPDDIIYGIGSGAPAAMAAGLALWSVMPKAVENPAWMLKQAITVASKLEHSVGLPIYSEQVK
jgi:hypothetical protein